MFFQDFTHETPYWEIILIQLSYKTKSISTTQPERTAWSINQPCSFLSAKNANKKYSFWDCNKCRLLYFWLRWSKQLFFAKFRFIWCWCWSAMVAFEHIKNDFLQHCVIPENIQTPTTEGISLKTPPPDFPFLRGTDGPPTPPEFPQVWQRPPNSSGKDHFHEARLLK